MDPAPVGRDEPNLDENMKTSISILPVKIVISGPLGAGKTTFIRTLSQTEVVDTEAVCTDGSGKPTTTVALDFGTLQTEEGTIHLYGTPGQERFSYMWEILCEGASGLILLVSGEDPAQFSSARKIHDCILSRVALPFVIGVTRQDLPRAWRPPEVARYFQLSQEQVLGLDARNPSSSLPVLQRVLEMLLKG
jgi:small GTP-binding protein